MVRYSVIEYWRPELRTTKNLEWYVQTTLKNIIANVKKTIETILLESKQKDIKWTHVLQSTHERTTLGPFVFTNDEHQDGETLTDIKCIKNYLLSSDFHDTFRSYYVRELLLATLQEYLNSSSHLSRLEINKNFNWSQVNLGACFSLSLGSSWLTCKALSSECFWGPKSDSRGSLSMIFF